MDEELNNKGYSKTIAASNAIMAYVGLVGILIALIKLFQEVPIFFRLTNKLIAIIIFIGGLIYVYYRSTKA